MGLQHPDWKEKLLGTQLGQMVFAIALDYLKLGFRFPNEFNAANCQASFDRQFPHWCDARGKGHYNDKYSSMTKFLSFLLNSSQNKKLYGLPGPEIFRRSASPSLKTFYP